MSNITDDWLSQDSLRPYRGEDIGVELTCGASITGRATESMQWQLCMSYRPGSVVLRREHFVMPPKLVRNGEALPLEEMIGTLADHLFDLLKPQQLALTLSLSGTTEQTVSLTRWGEFAGIRS